LIRKATGSQNRKITAGQFAQLLAIIETLECGLASAIITWQSFVWILVGFCLTSQLCNKNICT